MEVSDIEIQFDMFKDYLLAHGKQYDDYEAAFRLWLMRVDDFGEN